MLFRSAATHAPKGGKSRPESTNKSNGPTYREQVRLLLEAAGIPAAWVDSDRKRRGKAPMIELGEPELSEFFLWLQCPSGQRWLEGLKAPGGAL